MMHVKYLVQDLKRLNNEQQFITMIITRSRAQIVLFHISTCAWEAVEDM